MAGRNLGKALTILARCQAAEDALHADVDAFGAPGECHALVSKGQARRWRRARKHAKAVSGLPYRVLMRKVSGRAYARLELACLDKALFGRPY